MCDTILFFLVTLRYPLNDVKMALKHCKKELNNLAPTSDALQDLVPFVKFKKREKTPMEECYFK